jgi:hypothetical protein
MERTPFQAVRRRAALVRARLAAVSMLTVAVVAVAGWILPSAFPATALPGPSSLTVSSALAARVAATVPDEPTERSLVAAPAAASAPGGSAGGPAAGVPVSEATGYSASPGSSSSPGASSSDSSAAGMSPAGLTASPLETAGSGESPAGAPTSSIPASEESTPSPTTEIDVTARGHQAEVDRCLWVRMDLGAVAPVVGAHNFCGGDVILALEPGDLVRLTGEGLDGLYEVTGSRDAYAGDNAAAATAGLTATVLLQTCYFDGDAMRLVSLVPAAA